MSELLPLNKICEPIQEDLLILQRRLLQHFNNNPRLLAKLIEYKSGNTDSELPSTLILLSGRLFCCDLNLILNAAIAIEVLRTATIIHDDAVARSWTNHSRDTTKESYSEYNAILLGDYLLAKSADFICKTENLRVMRFFAETYMKITNASLRRLTDAFNTQQTCAQYIKMISGRNASMLSLATASGAILAQAPEQSIKTLKAYGCNLGISMQIMDDILDFVGDETEIFNTVGSKITQGFLTLPVILALRCHPGNNPIRLLFNNEGNKLYNIKLTIELVRNSPIIRECYKIALDYCERACKYLQMFSDNAIGLSLRHLANYVMDKKKEQWIRNQHPNHPELGGCRWKE